jgi:hypothetical protein
MGRRSVHFEVLCTAKYTVTVKNFCTVKLNSIFVLEICQHRINNSNSSRTGKNRQARPKIFVYIRVANLGDFSPEQILFF